MPVLEEEMRPESFYDLQRIDKKMEGKFLENCFDQIQEEKLLILSNLQKNPRIRKSLMITRENANSRSSLIKNIALTSERLNSVNSTVGGEKDNYMITIKELPVDGDGN